MVGRPPIPTSLKILRGNPGKRRLNRREAPLPNKAPPVPADLTPAAREEWDRILPILAAAGLMTDADRAGLAGYCTVWAELLEAQQHLRDEGTVITSSKGEPVLSPWYRASSAKHKELRAYLVEFGMTPASRSRIQVDVPVKEGELQQFRRRHPR